MLNCRLSFPNCITASAGINRVKFGPTSGLVDSKGISVIFIPVMRYNENHVCNPRKLVRFTPSPLIENGLMGVLKSPFFGKKNENDTPISCAPATKEVDNKMIIANAFFKVLIFCKSKWIDATQVISSI